MPQMLLTELNLNPEYSLKSLSWDAQVGLTQTIVVFSAQIALNHFVDWFQAMWFNVGAANRNPALDLMYDLEGKVSCLALRPSGWNDSPYTSRVGRGLWDSRCQAVKIQS